MQPVLREPGNVVWREQTDAPVFREGAAGIRTARNRCEPYEAETTQSRHATIVDMVQDFPVYFLSTEYAPPALPIASVPRVSVVGHFRKYAR